MTMTTKTGMVLEDTSIEFGSTADAASPALSQFPASDVQVDVPNWVLAVVVAVLLAVFAAVVQEDVAMDSPKKTVSLVRIDAIAWRLAAAAGVYGIHGAVSSSLDAFVMPEFVSDLSVGPSPELLMKGGLLTLATVLTVSGSRSQKSKLS